MNKSTEAKLEQAFTELLKQEGIPHVSGETIAREQDEVLLLDDLKSFLLQQYQTEELSESEVESIILRLKNLPSSDLYESNKAIMQLVSDGFVFKREDPNKKDLFIQLSHDHQGCRYALLLGFQ